MPSIFPNISDLRLTLPRPSLSLKVMSKSINSQSYRYHSWVLNEHNNIFRAKWANATSNRESIESRISII